MSGESQHWILIAAFRDGAADQKTSPTGAAGTRCEGAWAEVQAVPQPASPSSSWWMKQHREPPSKIWPAPYVPRKAVSLIKQPHFWSLWRLLFPISYPQEALSTPRALEEDERNLSEWLNKGCGNYPQREANTCGDLEKPKVIRRDEWE